MPSKQDRKLTLTMLDHCPCRRKLETSLQAQGRGTSRSRLYLVSTDYDSEPVLLQVSRWDRYCLLSPVIQNLRTISSSGLAPRILRSLKGLKKRKDKLLIKREIAMLSCSSKKQRSNVLKNYTALNDTSNTLNRVTNEMTNLLE